MRHWVTYEVKMLSKLVYQSFADQLVVLVVTRVVPVVEQGTEHGTRLPPVVGWVEDTRVTSEYVYAFIVDSRILRNELFGDLRRNILDRGCETTSVQSISA